jgi:hypothetical protein
VQVKRLISRRIRRSGQGFDLAADVNAVVSANVQERGRATTSQTSTGSSTSPGDDARGRDDTDRGRENP